MVAAHPVAATESPGRVGGWRCRQRLSKLSGGTTAPGEVSGQPACQHAASKEEGSSVERVDHEGGAVVHVTASPRREGSRRCGLVLTLIMLGALPFAQTTCTLASAVLEEEKKTCDVRTFPLLLQTLTRPHVPWS